MLCPQCQAENPDQAKFCLECGTKLQAVCPQCGAALPPQAKFCFECGAKIGAPPPPPPSPPPPPAPSADLMLAEALKRLVPQEFADRLLSTRGKVGSERRMVTMLFSDVKGSTAMGEQLDPEDLMDIMNGAFEVLIPPVYRHEGTLARLMGDAILAFFGAPLAHEDDAERAVRAALEIVAGAQEYAARLERAHGIKGFHVRVGINTGLVVVGEVGSDLRVEYTAMGDAINLAARMEQNAPVGGVLISHDTYLQVRGLFDVQALAPIEVKGKTEPVRVYVVQGARPRAFRMATRGVEGVETRMVGRDADLKRLQDAFYLAVEDAECQVVTVVGEAGVGKTRLLWEFENWLDEQPDATRHFHARASHEMQSVPYALLRNLFVLCFDIQESDPVQAVRDKLERGIGRMLGADEQGQMKTHLIGQLLGFDFGHSPFVHAVRDDARQLRDRALIYLGEFFQTVAAVSIPVILFEDIQWADDSSLDAIVHLASALAHQRLLIACLARPTLFDHRPHWGEGQAGHTRIDLQPLSRRDSRQLIEEILQRMEQVPVALRDMVVSGSEGNPLYVEELIKVLIEQGVITKASDGTRWTVDEARLAELRVPATLTGVLQARLDSLPLEQRSILQQAAVVGRTFWDMVVRRIGERSGDAWDEEDVPVVLSTLRSRELVAQHETSAFAGSQEFIFKHAALREVAYESILKKVRRGYHSLVADWLMEQSGERASEYTGLIAEHLELAGRTEEALAYLRQAGEQAAAQFANAEAITFHTRALALLDQLEWEQHLAAEERFALLLNREAVYHLLGQRGLQAADLAALHALVAELDREGPPDAGRRAEQARRQARYHEALSDFSAALASAQEAVAWAEQAADPAGMAKGLIQWGIVLWRQGQYDAARRPLDEALSLAREHGDRQAEAGSLHNLGTVAYLQGDSQAALDHLEEALRIRRELGGRRNEALSLNNLVVAYLGVGDLARALVGGEQTLAINQAIGDRLGEARALCNLALVYHQVGELAQSLDTHERALALARQLGDRSLEAGTLSNMAHTLIDLGDPANARALCEQAVALNRETGDRRGEGYSLTHLAFALEGLGEMEAAAAAYDEALRLRREIGQDGLAIDDLAGLAALAARQGRNDEAIARAREALDWMTAHEVASMSYPVRAYALAADALAAGGEHEQAAVALSAARALVHERAARISDPEVRAGFLQNVALHASLLADA
ncbi:MAG: tetratricopeptide repeat protein [Anaerolineae bacterium]|nr:tetratricopeptide repeat protein [Anaerolineae bacterium]